MDKTLLEIREECHKRLREIPSAPILWSNDVVNKEINNGLKDIARRTKCLWGKYCFVIDEGSQELTLPDNCFDIPRKRVVYDGDTHLTFVTLDQLNDLDPNWENADNGDPKYWFKKGSDSIWIYPPADTAGSRYSYQHAQGENKDHGRVVAIEDSESTDTYVWLQSATAVTADRQCGKIIDMVVLGEDGKDFKFVSYNPRVTNDQGRVFQFAIPDGNVTIDYVREPEDCTDDDELNELHNVFYYTLIYYVLWKCYSNEQQGKNLTLANVYITEYLESIERLMRLEKKYRDARSSRLQGGD